MKRKRRYVTGFALLVVLIVAALGIGVSGRNAAVLQARPNPISERTIDGLLQLTFELLNNDGAPLVVPDAWQLEFQDGKVQMLSLAASGNMRVPPGETRTIDITVPSTTNLWRLRAFYYREDNSFRVKTEVGRSFLGPYIPSRLKMVRGELLTSEWVEGGKLEHQSAGD